MERVHPDMIDAAQGLWSRVSLFFELMLVPTRTNQLLAILGLLLLSQSALCCCEFVLLADSMYLLGEVGVGFVGTTVGIAYASGFSGFTTPLVCRMAVSIF